MVQSIVVSPRGRVWFHKFTYPQKRAHVRQEMLTNVDTLTAIKRARGWVGPQAKNTKDSIVAAPGQFDVYASEEETAMAEARVRESLPASRTNEEGLCMPRRLHRPHYFAQMPRGSKGCARPSRFGNPFVVGVHGDAAACIAHFTAQFREDAAYRALVRRELRGKDLWCYCALDAPCHVDVLLPWAND